MYSDTNCKVNECISLSLSLTFSLSLSHSHTHRLACRPRAELLFALFLFRLFLLHLDGEIVSRRDGRVFFVCDIALWGSTAPELGSRRFFRLSLLLLLLRFHAHSAADFESGGGGGAAAD